MRPIYLNSKQNFKLVLKTAVFVCLLLVPGRLAFAKDQGNAFSSTFADLYKKIVLFTGQVQAQTEIKENSKETEIDANATITTTEPEEESEETPNANEQPSTQPTQTGTNTQETENSGQQNSSPVSSPNNTTENNTTNTTTAPATDTSTNSDPAAPAPVTSPKPDTSTNNNTSKPPVQNTTSPTPPATNKPVPQAAPVALNLPEIPLDTPTVKNMINQLTVPRLSLWTPTNQQNPYAYKTLSPKTTKILYLLSIAFGLLGLALINESKNKLKQVPVKNQRRYIFKT